MRITLREVPRSVRSVRMTLARLCSVGAIAAAFGAAPANFGVKPNAVIITAEHPIGEIALSSLNAKPVSFDAGAVSWEIRNGSDALQPVSGVLVLPPIFTIQPYGRALLRVAFRTPPVDADMEKSFKVVLTEIVPSGGAAPRVISVPFFVSARFPVEKSSFVLRLKPGLRAELTIVNTGNTHIYAGRLTIEANGETLYSGSTQTFVLANSSRTIALRLKAAPQGATAHVVIEGEEGESVSGDAVVQR